MGVDGGAGETVTTVTALGRGFHAIRCGTDSACLSSVIEEACQAFRTSISW